MWWRSNSWVKFSNIFMLFIVKRALLEQKQMCWWKNNFLLKINPRYLHVFFQSSIVLEDLYLFSLLWYSLSHYTLEYLVMLIFFENLYQMDSEILVYFWRVSLFGMLEVLILPIVFVSSKTNFSSFLLFLMMVCCFSWINSSMIEMLMVKVVWSNKC